ncbi:MAG: metal-sensitive transcriptional regulator [Candidatus Moranbacteria bacterium]|nr:metal-sensitive transcriptional regulator [Candidatus Moranbacteria bacterium]
MAKDLKKTTEKIVNRISRIEGQMRGLRLMVEEKKECSQIINQVLAVREAVASLGAEILQESLVCRISEKKKLDEKQIRALIKMQ